MTATQSMAGTGRLRELWLVWAYLIGYGAWTAARIGGGEPRGAVNDLLFLPFYLMAALAALRAARTPGTQPDISRGWILIGAAWGSSGIGAAIWMLGHAMPLGLLDQAAWLLYNAYYPLTLVGLWHFFERPRRGESWLQLVVEGSIVASATTVLAWYFVFRFHDAVAGPTRWFDLLAILLAGETLVMIAASAVLHRPRRSAEIGALTALALGAFVAAVADFVYEQSELIDSAWSGPGGDLLLATAAVLVASAGLMRPSTRPRQSAVAAGLSLLPYLAVTGVAGLLVYESIRANLGRGPIAGLIIGGAVLLVLVIARLLVSQRELLAETAARSAQDARFRLLVQQSADAIVVAAHDGSIRYASPSFSRMVGIDPSAGPVEGRTLLEFVCDTSRPEAVAWLASPTVDPPGRWQLGRPGAWFDVEAAGTDLTHDPVIAGIVLNIRDMTARVRLEAELRQAQKLEVAGRLSSSIAHDFNNLLTVILGSIQLAKASSHPQPLEAAESAAHRGATLARQLLSMSRPTGPSGGGTDLGEALRIVEGTLRTVLPSSIELAVKTPTGPVPVALDLVQVEQILLNLALNARDAMPAGGRLTVSVEVSAAGDGPANARITVRDTGTGMTEVALAHAFEPFFTTKAAGLGTGLGLSTVRRIVVEAGGMVHLTSPPGGGTVVTLSLPVSSNCGLPAPEPARASHGRGQGRILLVDDEAAVRQVIAALLDRRGYHVLEAGDGLAALDTLSKDGRDIDLVITDLVMPRLGGEELCRRLQASHPDLPLLCISGTPGVGTGSNEPWSAGSVIGKPIDIERLAERIETALRGAVGSPPNGASNN